MDLNDLFNAYNAKIETVISTNEAALTRINLEYPKTNMQQVYYKTIIEVVIFVVLALFLGGYVFSRIATPSLLICGLIACMFNVIALAGSIAQLVLIQQIDYSKPLVVIREKVEKVRLHELYIVKLLLFSAPFWWAFTAVLVDFLLGVDFIGLIDANIKTIYLVLNVLLVVPLIYFLRQLNPHNMHKKAVQNILYVLSSRQVLNALEELNKLEKFKK